MWDSNVDAVVVVVVVAAAAAAAEVEVVVVVDDNNYDCFDFHKEHHCDYPESKKK